MRPHTAFPRRTATPLVPLLLLLFYFAAHVASRVLISDALELDEAEQALRTQQLALGYSNQPPLYTWLQWAVFQLMGVSVLSLSVLKNSLLAATYVFVWLAARRVMAAPLAIAAAASMLLIPQIGWESQRDLTHSVLVTAMAAATLCVVVHLVERPRPALYIALGVTVALGMLSKYSFAVFLAALAFAVLTGRDARHAWRNPWLFASVLVAALVALPHAFWLFDNWQMASARTLEKLQTEPGALAGIARGTGSLAGAIAATLAALAIALSAIFGRAAWHAETPSAPCRLWRRYLLALGALMLALIVIGGATHFKGRWLQPLLFTAPLMFFCCRPGLAGHPRLHWLHRTLFVLALVYLAMASLRPAFDGWRDRPDELNEPAAELAAALRSAGYDGRSPIVTSDAVLGGVLRVRFPQATVSVWQKGAPAPASTHGRPLLIGKGEAAGEMFGQAGDRTPLELALPYRHARPGRAPVDYRYVLPN